MVLHLQRMIAMLRCPLSPSFARIDAIRREIYIWGFEAGDAVV